MNSMEEVINNIYKTAEEFGNIAGKVNDSSIIRKKHSNNAIDLINKSNNISGKLRNRISSISKLNITQRAQDNLVLNSCLILNENIEKQKELTAKLHDVKFLNKSIFGSITEILNIFTESLNKALSVVSQIIDADNKIIFMNKQIIILKKFQEDCTNRLHELLIKSDEDAENAVKRSTENLERGSKMVEQLKIIKTLIEKNEFIKISELSEEANFGWNTAIIVNDSSTQQLEFTEKIFHFAKKFHGDSINIKNAVSERFETFSENLEQLVVLTVLLAVEFQDYFRIEDVLNNIKIDDASAETQKLFNNLTTFIKIAENDITDLTSLNYDMAETLNSNTDFENKFVEFSEFEHEYYTEIKQEVEAITKATKYPIQGSEKNVINGQALENYLKEIIIEMEKKNN